MAEHLYTIAINEHFAQPCFCPICSLRAMLEKNEIDAVTGAAMMEPSVRIETNRHGFCHTHFEQMLTNGKRLPVALVMQSHLEEIRARLDGGKPDSIERYLSDLEQDCYVCRRIDEKTENVLSNVIYLWKTDDGFRDRFSRIPSFCLPHYRALLAASRELGKKDRIAFCEDLNRIETGALAELNGDIDWFCKKFDYRFQKEDWKNSKDAPERTVQMLTSRLPADKRDM